MTRPTVLFVGHGADRTGPPVFLANFQGWLARHGDTGFATVLTRGGPLLDDYRARGPVRVLDRRWTIPRIAQQGLARSGHPRSASGMRALRDRAQLRGWERSRGIYVNTASPSTLRVLAHAADSSRVIAHVHEMEVALRHQLDDAERALLLERPDRFIAASRAVADNLAANHDVPAGRIEVHHEFVEPVEPATGAERAAVRRSHGIAEDAFVVGASGMTEWRKGPDLFVHLAREVRRRTDRTIAFVWVGGATSGPHHWPLDHEARHLGVDDIVRFVGTQADPGSWFRALDVFALTSREDAFPLAALEAATADVPVVTFDTGGMVEFVTAGGGGAVVPYPDLVGFATLVAELAEDEPRRSGLAAAAGHHARAHHVTEVAAPRLSELVDEVLG